MAAATATPDPSSIICHNCGKAGHYRRGCAVPASTNEKSNKTIGQKKKSGSRGSAGQKWCAVHRTTTHNDTECYAQGAPRSQTSSTHTAAVGGAQNRSIDTDNKPVVHFDDDFDRVSHFSSSAYQQGPPGHQHQGSPYFINAGSPERRFTGSLQTKTLEIAEKTTFENRYSSVRRDCRSFRSRRINNSKNGSAGNDYLLNAAAAGNGTFVFAGNHQNASTGTASGDRKMGLMKVDMHGDTLWSWQVEEGSATGVGVAEDESIVIGGFQGVSASMAAVMFHPDGEVVWQWESGDDGVATAMTRSENGSTVLAGYKGSDFAACKLSVDGTLQWEWQNGSLETDYFTSAAASEDGSVVLAGLTEGNWAGLSAGSEDFAAVKIDSEGTEVWRWQEGTEHDDVVTGVAIWSDGSVLLAGKTDGAWTGASAGDKDFTAVKLDPDGNEIWRWQDGTAGYDAVAEAMIRDDGSAVLVGSTTGKWASSNAGSWDFAVVILDGSGNELWRWQNGTSTTDYAQAIASSGLGSQILVAGYTTGVWSGTNMGLTDFVAVLLDTGTLASAAPTPTPSQSQSPAASNSPSVDPTTSRGMTDAPTSGMSPSVAPTPFFVSPKPSGRGITEAPTPHPGTPKPTPTSSPTLAAGGDGVILKPVVWVAILSAVICLMGLVCAFWLYRRRSRLRRGDAVSDFGNIGHVAGASGLHSIAPSSTTMTPEQRHLPLKGESAGSSTAKRNDTATQSAPSASLANMPYVPVVQRRNAAIMPLRRSETFLRGIRDSVSESSREGSPIQGSAFTKRVVEQERIGGADVVHAIPEVTESANVSSGSSRSAACGFGVAQALMGAAQELTRLSQIPGVAEVAGLVIVLMNLVMDNSNITGTVDYMVKRCRSILLLLQRAASVLEEADIVADPAHRVFIQDVRDAVGDLVEIITTYKSKGRISQIMMSTLFKRRQDEADAVIDAAIGRLQFGLHIQVGHKLDKLGQELREVLHLQRQESKPQMSETCPSATVLLEARRIRRRRNLDKVEIPEHDVTVSDELLGKGGFGAVYIADYNGRNAAAKVVQVDHDLGRRNSPTEELERGMTPLEPPTDHGNNRRKAFWRELQAMIRLRSPHTVHLYGAIISRQDRLVLVMELLPGGDLRGMLKDATEPLLEEHARRIVRDICAGMTFLHKKETVHGDLKSPNVLFDGTGRAKIGDFGTSKWQQLTDSTGLASYTTRANHTTHMSLAWAAPEVLNAKGSSYASDVYSFGVVVWEVFSRKLPWAEEECPRDIYVRVVFKEDRPEIPVDSPRDMSRVMSACWAGEPKERPTFNDVLIWQSWE